MRRTLAEESVLFAGIFSVGAAAGSLVGSVFGLDRATFAALGLVSLLAGAASTPIAAAIMASRCSAQGSARTPPPPAWSASR